MLMVVKKLDRVQSILTFLKYWHSYSIVFMLCLQRDMPLDWNGQYVRATMEALIVMLLLFRSVES